MGTEIELELKPAHLDQAHGLSQRLKWPFRVEDWAFALELGHGFAVEAPVEGQTRLVGTALWWPYGTDFATVGMIIVSPDAQRQGIGARLMAALLDAASGRRVILNSTQEGYALYTKLGFKPYGAVTQHQAVLATAPAVDGTVPVRAARAEDRAAILALDARGSGMDRKLLLDALLGIAETVVVERGTELTGYGCVRRWGRGVVIGPVIAGTAAEARAIIATLAAKHVGGFVRVDTTDACGLAPWLVEIGLPQVDRVIAMSLGAPPQPAPGATLFALSNQSLG